MVDDSLGIDKGENLHEVEGGDSSAASFTASVEECISERECKLNDEGLNSYLCIEHLARRWDLKSICMG